MAASRYNLVIIGGGIVGLAVAREALRRRPDLRLAVLEKESQVGQHQTGHNSGVIHAGIYYAPGSLKAQAAVEGGRDLLNYCRQHNIQHSVCGKVIVATNSEEIPRLEALFQRGKENGARDLELIGPERLRELEPHAIGRRAIWSPHTAIVDFPAVAKSFAREVQAAGGEMITSCKVTHINAGEGRSRLRVFRDGQPGEIEAEQVIACAGLHSDRLARSAGENPMARIIPFRGDYYRLRPEKTDLVRALIYPVPDPQLPFLGVHFTRTVAGEVWAGPNAVLALAREGYRRGHVNLPDVADMIRWPGFWRMAARWWRVGVSEMARDTLKALYLRDLQRYIPALTSGDLISGPSGVRAQAVARSGALADDFLISRTAGVTHVVNAPSPAATSSLALARIIVSKSWDEH